MRPLPDHARRAGYTVARRHLGWICQARERGGYGAWGWGGVSGPPLKSGCFLKNSAVDLLVSHTLPDPAAGKYPYVEAITLYARAIGDSTVRISLIAVLAG